MNWKDTEGEGLLAMDSLYEAIAIGIKSEDKKVHKRQDARAVVLLTASLSQSNRTSN